MKRLLIAIFLCNVIQEKLYADYIGPVEYTIFVLLIIGIVKESDRFYENKAKKIAVAKQYKETQDTVMPLLELQPYQYSSLNLNILDKKNQIISEPIFMKKIYNRLPLKESKKLYNNWAPLKSSKYS